jgi:hypothetical protein
MMKAKLLFIFCIAFYLPAHASGITGSSGNELLYLYVLLLVVFVLPIGLDYSIRWCIKKWKERRLIKKYEDFENLI